MRVKNDFHIKGYPRFETEAWGNSEMAYFSGEKIVLKKCKHHFEILLNFQSRDQMPKTIKNITTTNLSFFKCH